MLHQAGIPIPNMVKFSSICINRTEDGVPDAEKIMEKQTAYKACAGYSRVIDKPKNKEME